MKIILKLIGAFFFTGGLSFLGLIIVAILTDNGDDVAAGGIVILFFIFWLWIMYLMFSSKYKKKNIEL